MTSSMTSRMTSSHMTMFEYTTLLSFRATQLSFGNEPVPEIRSLLKSGEVLDFIFLAEMELKYYRDQLNLSIRRRPNGKVEIWKAKDLLLPPL